MTHDRPYTRDTTDTPQRDRAEDGTDLANGPSPALSRQILFQATTGVVIQDLEGHLEWLNPAAEAMFRVSVRDVIGQKVLGRLLADEAHLHAETPDDFSYDTSRSLFSRDHLARHRRADGSLFWNLQSFMLIQMAGMQKVAIFCRDVTDEVENQNNLSVSKAQLEHAAFHDDLTGLANRKRLKTYLDASAVQSAFARRALGVLQLDVDKFKEINDTLGHAAGDTTLVHIANALREAAEPRDLACRLGGDEFVLVCYGLSSSESLVARAKLLMRNVARALLWKDQTIRPRVSIGASLVEDGSDSPQSLIHQADQALYAAKAQGRGRVVVFSPQLGQVQTAQNQLARDVRLAVADEQLEVHLQPQLNLRQGRICGVETLLRWNHPQRGCVPPGDFLETAARAGVMADIDYCAMNLSLDALQRLHKAGFRDLTLSINVSSEILRDANYPGLLDWALQSRGLKAHNICIEVLETTIMERDTYSVRTAVERLKALGARVALDDFGTGFAGLSHMSALDVDAIKLDRSIIKGLDTDARNRAIVSSIIDLCQRLGINVVAEGVETREQLQILKQVRCPEIQGFILAKPMGIGALISWLTRNMPIPEAWDKLQNSPPVTSLANTRGSRPRPAR